MVWYFGLCNNSGESRRFECKGVVTICQLFLLSVYIIIVVLIVGLLF